MFEALAEKFDSLLRKLQGQGRITERNIEDALRDVRLALLEADVNLQVVRDFVEAVKRDALGQEVLRSLTPEQHFLRLVHRELVRLLGEGPGGLDLGGAAPAVILLVGLNGSGKTTTAAKLARHLRAERSRTPYLVAADLYRPAAIEQLETLARQLDLPVHPARAGDDPVALARAAIEAARASGRDTVLIDTAGRQTVDETLMRELERMVTAVTPRHVLLVADAMTGQDAVATAQGFAGRLPVSGIVLTKMEGDARGGAALSLRTVAGKPILFAGTGEKLDALEPFHADRIASRILGMGDVLSLIERAERAYDRDQAQALEKKLRKSEFDLEDFRDQLRAVKKMGSVAELLGMIPGVKKLLRGADLSGAEGELKRVEAIIDSMTRAERRNIRILNASRRKRIAEGSGTSVSEVNRLVKQFTQTKKLLKKIGSGAMPPGMQGLPGLPR
ncbi:MAG: signal recognition particle protein [Deltaproteobacteria bacterium]|nr:MAG: signal recognition particle protein [Deltaproteobacteria bacterium]TMB15557.1 MAG: signal recognition particle protein [Deltaproteobacteria bacterium]